MGLIVDPLSDVAAKMLPDMPAPNSISCFCKVLRQPPNCFCLRLDRYSQPLCQRTANARRTAVAVNESVGNLEQPNDAAAQQDVRTVRP